MEKKRKSKRNISWGLGVVILDSDGKKIGKMVKIPKRILENAKPIKKSVFLNPQYEEIMRCIKTYKIRKR